MLGAAYALPDAARCRRRGARSSGATRPSYGVPLIGRRCLLRPHCWGNLKLVDALAVLAITGAGDRAPRIPAARLGDPGRGARGRRAVVNARIAQVADRALQRADPRTRRCAAPCSPTRRRTRSPTTR